MEINDRVYDREKIEEGVLIELNNSNYLQRLKGVFQLGMPPEYDYRESYTRYEHSLGVLVLLKRLGADLKEQISGFLHDGSHTAFSHVIDWVVGDPSKEDYQDKRHLKSIINSEIPEILSKYNFDYEEISDLGNFSLLEKEAPDLCADRIDYTLRELKMEGKNINGLVDDLVVKDKEIFFRTFECANFFAREYAGLQRDHWGGDEARTRYYLLSKSLKKAIDRKIVSISDLENKGDYEIIHLLEESGNEEVNYFLNMLKEGFKMERVKEGGILLQKKFRHVNPKILLNGVGKRLSELSLDYKLLLEDAKQDSKIKRRILINEYRTIF